MEEQDILEAFRERHSSHYPQIQQEHGQYWVTCLDCGSQWSVVETSDGFDFELVTEGDNFCWP